jgi:hypothetical protein
LCFLAGVPFKPTDPALAKSAAAREDLDQGEGLPLQTLLGLRGIYHRNVPMRKVQALAGTPETAQAQQNGPLTALYKIVFQATAAAGMGEKGLPEDLQMLIDVDHDLTGALAQAVATIPVIEGRIAIVLDLSASMLSSGERLYHPVSLALALTRLLQDRVREVVLCQVGGSSTVDQHRLAMTQGDTDIASTLLIAARQQPQAIFVITDGYENIRQGDAALVVQGLRLLMEKMPIYQIVPLFTTSERLTRRRLDLSLPTIPLTHEDGVRELLAYTLLASDGESISRREAVQLQTILLTR